MNSQTFLTNIDKTKPLKNLIKLRRDMESKDWVMHIFSFTYKTQSYYVVIELYQPNEIRPEFALCKLKFIDASNLNRKLLTPANSCGLMTDAQTIREYFGINWTSNLGDILKQFAQQLGKFIPESVRPIEDRTMKDALDECLSEKMSDDPNKKYCIGVKRNPRRADGSLGQRSVYNDNKARLRCPQSLYDYFKNDWNISFCFSSDIAAERTEKEIIDSYVSNYQ